MRPDTITISSRIDTKAFRRFAVFDTLIRQKRYRSPAIFAGIMLVFACICYLMNGRAEQAVLLGNVLLCIGIVLPVVYFGTFYFSVNSQAKKMKLEPPRHVYTVTMTDDEEGISIVTPTGEGGTLRVKWANLHMAYRVAGCIYFFISPRQAFLFPDDQANVTPDELWDFLKEKMPEEKLSDRRKAK